MPSVPEKEMKRVVAIIDSMTPKERRDHTVLNGNRKKRIAKGSGTSVPEINRLIKQFLDARRMMKSLVGGGQGGKGIRKEEKTRKADPGDSCSVTLNKAPRFLWVHLLLEESTSGSSFTVNTNGSA